MNGEDFFLEKIRTFKIFVRFKYKTKVPVNADSNSGSAGQSSEVRCSALLLDYDLISVNCDEPSKNKSHVV